MILPMGTLEEKLGSVKILLCALNGRFLSGLVQRSGDYIWGPWRSILLDLRPSHLVRLNRVTRITEIGYVKGGTMHIGACGIGSREG